MDLGLKDKVAVVTGGSKGIGFAAARVLAQEGVHLVLCAREAGLLLEKATELQNQYSVAVLGLPTDVTNPDAISRSVTEVEKAFNGADILIDNAGIGSNETILNAPDDKWRYYWELHVMASVRLARGLIPLMRKRGGGVILHNASICAKQPLGHEPIYNVTKAALMMFSKCLANEVIQDNIRVNCINPGLILTSAWEQAAKQKTEGTAVSWERYLDQIAKEYTPIGRFASPEELATFMVFLCSPRASYCVGSTYYVDGGWLKVVS
jgi:NAD(P)-dependent dehydrogenase (short-subunit alcohol dehydrogenase family)